MFGCVKFGCGKVVREANQRLYLNCLDKRKRGSSNLGRSLYRNQCYAVLCRQF